MKPETPTEKLKRLFEKAIDSGTKLPGGLNNIDFISIFFKAAVTDSMFKFLGSNSCMFICKYEGDDSVIALFSLPIRSNMEGDENKHVSERVMDVIKVAEEAFVTLDSVEIEEAKEDKFMYIKVIKKIEKGKNSGKTDRTRPRKV
jgi:hypothetical protein